MPDETRASIVIAQPAIAPDTIETRASQVIVQPAIVPDAIETRASLVVVQFAISLADAVPGGGGSTERAWGYILG